MKFVTSLFLFLFIAKINFSQSCVGGNSLEVTLRNCAGITKAGQSSFLISPNPATTSLNILLNNDAYFDLLLTDITGKEIFNKQNIYKNYVLNTSTFSNGIYFLRIRDEHGESWIQKIEIQNN